uniref:serine/threonine-protein kinase NIM1-like isoform X1 n=2 Tax=Myxine glutinosa TaxID=7769 RepID=UPI00358F3B29
MIAALPAMDGDCSCPDLGNNCRDSDIRTNSTTALSKESDFREPASTEHEKLSVSDETVSDEPAAMALVEEKPVGIETIVEDTVAAAKEGGESATIFEQRLREAREDETVIKEVAFGRRLGFYQLRGEIGSGNFSQVRFGVHLITQEKVAVKIINKNCLDPKSRRLLPREISAMETLRHPAVIRLYEVLETMSRLYLVTELAPGGDLFTRLQTRGRLSEDEAQSAFGQIVAAVAHMHENHIVHRDLKAENVFLGSGGCVKVGDFGFSTVCHPQAALCTFCGSPPYAAPELFTDENYNGVAVDMWALGILLYFMVIGHMPFRADTVGKLKLLILHGSYSFPPHLSKTCTALIRRILNRAPSARPCLLNIVSDNWMCGAPAPAALPPFPLEPSHLAVPIDSLSGINFEIATSLAALGISPEHIKNSGSRDGRNCITGTYRILLHRAQQHHTPDHTLLFAAPASNMELKTPLSLQTTSTCPMRTPPVVPIDTQLSRRGPQYQQAQSWHQDLFIKRSKLCCIL